MLALRAFLIRLLGVKECGAYGGRFLDNPRWCYKPYGHSDSCSYEVDKQPGNILRSKFRGW